jgi:TolB-like protein/DNA-binding winged helix-turn-helix (wHTH) protein/tetratricopeptide (TPR) repeat protein
MESAPPPPPVAPTAYRVADLLIDVTHRRVTRAGTEITLSDLSFDLLLELTRGAPHVVSFEQLMQRVWPRLVVGPETISQRVKVVREALGDDANSPRYIAGVRARGYRIVADVEPLTSTASAEPAHSSSATSAAAGELAAKAPRASRSRTYGVAGALVVGLVLGYVAVERHRHSVARGKLDVVVEAPANKSGAAVVVTAPDRSIAVLPFTDFSEEHNQEYFSDGLAGEVIDQLTRLPGLQVSARTSSFSFKGQRITIAEIAKALRVSNVLEGTVRKTRDRIRVTAQLVRADNGYVRWSERYIRDPGDIFKVQDEIAAAVARALNIELQPGRIGNRPAPPQIDAYTLALEGRYFLERHTPEDYEKATTYYRRALDLDRRYAPAWVGYASATWLQGDMGSMPWDTARARARDAAERAVQLDPGLPAAHLIMSAVLANDLDWVAAARELDAALALDPGDASTLMAKATWTSSIAGQPGEAIGLAQQAVLRDPVTPGAHYRLCWIYFDAGRLADAANACRESLELSPNLSGAHFTIASLLLARGQPDAALAEVAREPDDAFRLRGLAIVTHHLGRRAESDTALATLLKRYSTKHMLFIASVYAARGERDAAFAWLERARAHRESQLYEVKSAAMFGQLQSDPRYKAFLRSVKLSE